MERKENEGKKDCRCCGEKEERNFVYTNRLMEDRSKWKQIHRKPGRIAEEHTLVIIVLTMYRNLKTTIDPGNIKIPRLSVRIRAFKLDSAFCRSPLCNYIQC